ncbi:MAG TPA: ATP-binding protein [Gemmatimonas sp.]|nr:ATP-binding protein [Gemmatimonas sp.]
MIERRSAERRRDRREAPADHASHHASDSPASTKVDLGELLMAAIDQLDEIVLLVRPGANPGAPPQIVFANAAIERVLGLRRHGPMLGEYHRDSTPAELQQLRSLVAEGLDCHAPARCQVVWTTTTGRRHCLDVSSVPVQLPEDAGVAHWAVVARDVTEQEALTARSAHAQRLESLGLLAGSIAHDFNNLVHVVTGFSELALAKLPKTGAATTYIQQAHDAALRAASLAKQLLGFSRRQSVKPVTVDVRGILDGLLPVLSRLAGTRVTVSVEPGNEPAVVCADPTQLEQILLNLVVNARDAQPEGGSVAVKLDVADGMARDAATDASKDAPDEPRRWVRLRVRDAGPGISPEIQKRVFEPFFTTKSQGTGLGLSTVHRIVRDAKGTTRLSSPPEGGLEVEILLPEAPRGKAACHE